MYKANGLILDRVFIQVFMQSVHVLAQLRAVKHSLHYWIILVEIAAPRLHLSCHVLSSLSVIVQSHRMNIHRMEVSNHVTERRPNPSSVPSTQGRTSTQR